MGLYEEVKQISNESYDKWFERWWKREGIENKITKKASQGFSEYVIDCLSEDEYIHRRLKDDRMVEHLEEKLPNFECERKTGERKIPHIIFAVDYNEIVISW